MREARLVHPAAHLFLDRVVADGPGRVDRVLDVLLADLGEDRLTAGVPGLGGVCGPDARVAVRLQFEHHRITCSRCRDRAAWPGPPGGSVPTRSWTWWPYSWAST